jgi:hypothetical protein
MPSKLKQWNVRLSPEDEAIVGRLLVRAKEVTGLDVSQSDLFRLAVRALDREYAARSDPPPAPKRARR